ncbi:LacI family DNA-binding transcriptional regulator [Desulforamulus ruminis]|uniref:Regulatory protein LacI n=1 Tax=Desulforamulus ruminis (strain ATCC 23193 / DSM 2154 / NCIMB 8452 / DL) TaxID=696281 RepID=F6DQM8_DESRL|nr:LacI family DNA-binding transcriptional regulator [Desulforamulus ruminis]AEG62025.1 regulatory protein LacI [Desulforamulus ruminis DSM 2154]
MATIKDVAKLASVSVGTVSRFLNGYTIKEENQTRIEQAIQTLDFKFNPIARGLRTNKTYSVGVLIPRISDIFCTQVIEGIEEVLEPLNYSILICSSNDKLELQREKINFLQNKCVDGIIAMPVTSAEFNVDKVTGNGTPVVLIDRLVKDCELDAVVADNVNGAYLAVEMIINKGHQKIGIIAGPQEIYTAQERLMGYLRALNDYHIEVNEDYIIHTQYKKDGGIDAFHQLISLPDRPTAIFTTNYPITVNTMRLMLEKGLQIGQDVSLCGYDQTELFQMLNPPISVVVQPSKEIGIQAAEILLKRIGGDFSRFPQIQRLKTSLIATDSVKTLF